MINHARCFLANLPPLNAFGEGAYVAEEIIDPRFVKVRLPGYLELIRKALFGENPDRDMVNYRTRQLLTLVHATPLVDHVTAKDKRITYSVGEDLSLIFDSLFMPFQRQLNGDDAPELLISGGPEAPDAQGKVFLSYTVRTTSSTSLLVTPQLASNLVFSYEVVNGTSNTISLPGSGYSVRLRVAGSGYEWLVNIRNRPQWDMGQIAVLLETIGEGAMENLFFGNAEPYVTYRELWLKQEELPLKLSGLIMALISRTEEASHANR